MQHLRTFINDFFKYFYAPSRLFKEIRAGRDSPSWLLVLIYCLVYVIGTFILYFTGKQPVVEPWLNIDPKTYYICSLLTIGGTALATRTEERINWLGSSLAAIAAVTVAGIMMFTYIR